MLIRVIYSDRSVGLVDYDSLETLIKRGKIFAFFKDEWIPFMN
jgi:hypothetical protein